MDVQGVPKVLTRFCEAISRELLGLQKWHTCKKMRLILKFCLVFFKMSNVLLFFKVMLDLRKKVFLTDFCAFSFVR
jgi:hypothetical protein